MTADNIDHHIHDTYLELMSADEREHGSRIPAEVEFVEELPPLAPDADVEEIRERTRHLHEPVSDEDLFRVGITIDHVQRQLRHDWEPLLRESLDDLIAEPSHEAQSWICHDDDLDDWLPLESWSPLAADAGIDQIRARAAQIDDANEDADLDRVGITRDQFHQLQEHNRQRALSLHDAHTSSPHRDVEADRAAALTAQLDCAELVATREAMQHEVTPTGEDPWRAPAAEPWSSHSAMDTVDREPQTGADAGADESAVESAQSDGLNPDAVEIFRDAMCAGPGQYRLATSEPLVPPFGDHTADQEPAVVSECTEQTAPSPDLQADAADRIGAVTADVSDLVDRLDEQILRTEQALARTDGAFTDRAPELDEPARSTAGLDEADMEPATREAML